jgi:hypothetical protein
VSRAAIYRDSRTRFPTRVEPPGLLVTNPPYGDWLKAGGQQGRKTFYFQLGEQIEMSGAGRATGSSCPDGGGLLLIARVLATIDAGVLHAGERRERP